MDKYIGRLLDGRYEILEEIGRGGMAVVYRARCHRLNRFVAVKILKEDLSRDEDFRRRFHAESQAVAMLSNPNIVAVYDVNHSNDADYIVMELIDGLTLKQYMQQRGALSWREALHFATQIAKALEHAHGRGIVHRDIKPHNIMILKDGSVKVADFGIARLNSTQNTLTREALGSVHYISPEQAKGSQVDARSDLYSLGVVMYEMLTGRPPYDGESPVAIAIQHINATPTPPRQLNNTIPLGLQQITLHAMCSDLSARYASATAMIEDLEALRKNPQIVFRFNAGPGGTTAYVDAHQVSAPTAAAGAQASAQQGAAGQNVPRPAQQAQSDPTRSPNRPVDPQQAARQKARSMAQKSVQRASQEKRAGTRRGYDPDPYEDEDETDRSKVPIIIVSVLLVLVLLFGFLAWRTFFADSGDNMIPVPNFLGKHLEDVLDNPAYDGLNLVEGEHVYSNDYPAGEICEQSVTANQKVTSGTTVRLNISKGTQSEPMPQLVGKTVQEVDALMSDLITKLSISITYNYSESDTVDEGHIISTDPAGGAMLSAGSTVTILVSSGKGESLTTVPDVEGLTEEDAKARLQERNLYASVSYVENDAEEGLVFYQSIKSGQEVPEGTTVSIKVSLGRPEPSPSPSPSPTPSPSPSPTPTPTPTPATPTPEPPTPTPVTPTPEQPTPTPVTPTPEPPTPTPEQPTPAPDE